MPEKLGEIRQYEKLDSHLNMKLGEIRQSLKYEKLDYEKLDYEKLDSHLNIDKPNTK